MIVASSVVDWSALGKVVAYSLAAGVGVTLAFGLAVRGTIRFADMRRDGRVPESTVYLVLALAGLAVTAGAVAYGIYLMTQK